MRAATLVASSSRRRRRRRSGLCRTRSAGKKSNMKARGGVGHAPPTQTRCHPSRCTKTTTTDFIHVCTAIKFFSALPLGRRSRTAPKMARFLIAICGDDRRKKLHDSFDRFTLAVLLLRAGDFLKQFIENRANWAGNWPPS